MATFKCPVPECTATSTRANGLKKHVNVHLEQSFCCIYCNMSSKQESAVKSHMRGRSAESICPNLPAIPDSMAAPRKEFDARGWLWYKKWTRRFTVPVFVNPFNGDAMMVHITSGVVWECREGTTEVRIRNSNAAIANSSSRGSAPPPTEANTSLVPFPVSALPANLANEIYATSQAPSYALDASVHTSALYASGESPASSFDTSTPPTADARPANLLDTGSERQPLLGAGAGAHTDAWISGSNFPMNYTLTDPQGRSFVSSSQDLARTQHHGAMHHIHYGQADAMRGAALYLQHNGNAIATPVLESNGTHLLGLGARMASHDEPLLGAAMAPTFGMPPPTSLGLFPAVPVRTASNFAGYVWPTGSHSTPNGIVRAGAFANDLSGDQSYQQWQQHQQRLQHPATVANRIPQPTEAFDGPGPMLRGRAGYQSMSHSSIQQPYGAYDGHLQTVPNTFVPYFDTASMLPLSPNPSANSLQPYSTASLSAPANPFPSMSHNSGLAPADTWPTAPTGPLGHAGANLIASQLAVTASDAVPGARNVDGTATAVGSPQSAGPSVMFDEFGAFSSDTIMSDDASMDPGVHSGWPAEPISLILNETGNAWRV